MAPNSNYFKTFSSFLKPNNPKFSSVGNAGSTNIGTQLGEVERLLLESNTLPETFSVGVLYVDVSAARSWLLDSLTEHKTKIHQKVVG